MTEDPKCILLVDDDQDDHYILTEQLVIENPGIQIKSVYNGMQALDYLRHCPANMLPLLIIMDYHMPVMSGPETLAVLKEQIPYVIPVVIWSTSDNIADKIECLGLGAIAYYEKPRNVGELKQLVKKVSRML